jgi:hypothetical protein
MDVLDVENRVTKRRVTRLPWMRVLGWTVFASAFGYTEAAVVVYIRRLLGEASGLDYRQVFTLKHMALSSANVLADMARHGILPLERTREAATLLLLFGAAWAAGHGWRERLAVFLYTFAVWDIAYYFFLVPLSGFPRSLGAIDVYFLLPIASYGPVWFPVLVVMPMLIAFAYWLWRRGNQDPLTET